MKILQYYYTKGLFWFRIFGYGLHLKNKNMHPELYSERTGARRKLKVSKYRIGILTPGATQ